MSAPFLFKAQQAFLLLLHTPLLPPPEAPPALELQAMDSGRSWHAGASRTPGQLSTTIAEASVSGSASASTSPTESTRSSDSSTASSMELAAWDAAGVRDQIQDATHTRGW
ncbi:uncharacterized protein EHS24_004484 [Apiotrichum porosum]|uniref:Uncharacterized protein n=1 Tax=Apiotrichum porosum TaxID=105984 RepID=A0A427Y584_9TREE|nr:uncharacterized protein EHS24_004484 [Apiotrichum porosum]RSH86246.1 hypothetical protein EHS24_004484 [Apiotrichum porosum]